MKLLKAIRAVSRLESSELRQSVFDDIASRSITIRLAERLHRICKCLGISYLLVMPYGLYHYLRAVLPVYTPRWLATAFYLNELKQIDHLDQTMGGAKPERVYWRYVNTGSWLALMSALWHVRDIYRFMRMFAKVEKPLRFMPACRVAAMCFLYVRFHNWLLHNRVRAIVVTSDYNPDAVALSSAAASFGIPRIYIPHALPGYNLEFRTLLDFEWYIFDSKAMFDRFSNRCRLTGPVLYRGAVGETRPLALEKLKPSAIRIGIFLTGPTEMQVLEDSIKKLQRFTPPYILIRGHPVSFSNPDFSGIEQRYQHVRISKGATLAHDIDACDLVIAGNSTVIIETLKQGTPCVYMGALDFLPYDYNGFVKNGLVPDIKSVDDIDINKIREFFGSQWKEHMIYFDAAYGQNADQIKQEIRRALLAVIG